MSFGKLMITIDRPSGEMCGNQLFNSSLVICCGLLPSASMRQICISPLRTELKNGDQVEVLTSPTARPNPSWLSFVGTGKARSRIRHFLKGLQQKESAALGERMLDQALATLKFARKHVAHDIEKVLRSAIANAQQKEGFGGDVERLYVSACYADQGPSMKRVRPAPMGRAFRVVKRTTNLTVKVAERAVKIAAAGVEAPARARGAASKRATPKAKTGTRKAAAKKAGV